MAMIKKIKDFIAKETVLCVAAVCAILTMFLVPPDREYLHYIDFRVLCLLLCLMAVVAGLKAVGLFNWLTYQLLRRIRSGRVLGITLVLLPFFCSMFVTNDVALIIFIPFYGFKDFYFLFFEHWFRYFVYIFFLIDFHSFVQFVCHIFLCKMFVY